MDYITSQIITALSVAREELVNKLASGYGVSDYPSYTRALGKIEGLAIVRQVIEKALIGDEI